LPPPRACTFDPADWQIIARCWYPVALASVVTEQPLGVTLLNQPLVVYRFGGQIVVADDPMAAAEATPWPVPSAWPTAMPAARSRPHWSGTPGSRARGDSPR
jgi:hypothetical protein